MAKKCVSVLLFVVLIPALIPALSEAGVVYSERGGVTIMVVSGTWYEMGYQTGSEREFHATILPGLKHILRKYGEEKFTGYYDKVKDMLPEDVRDQMNGMAKGLSDSAGITYEEAFNTVVAWNFVFDVVNLPGDNCSALAVSDGTNTYLAHNTDQQYGGEGGALISIYKPAEGNGRAFVSYFGPQFIGVTLGANDMGLALVYNTTRQKGASYGMPAVFMSRIVLNKAETFEQALGLFREFLLSGKNFGHSAANFTLMDFKSKRMARIEVSSGRIEIEEGIEHRDGVKWITATNHYIKMQDLCPELPASSAARLADMERLVETSDDYGIQSLLNIFSDHGETHLASGNTICVHKTGQNTAVETVLTHIFDENYNIFWSSGQPCGAVDRQGGMRCINWKNVMNGKSAEPFTVQFSILDKFLPEGYPDLLKSVIVRSGRNAGEIVRAIDYFHGEPLKQKALCFLLLQTPYRCFRAVDADKMEIEPKIDAENISSDILIDTIELGFKAREIYPWTAELPMDMFVKFVLAYRGTGEKLENWRKAFWEDAELRRIFDSYAKLYSGARTPAMKTEIFRKMMWDINSVWISGKVKYAPRGLPDYTPSELAQAGTGRCTDLVNFQCAVLRTYGVAVTGTREIWWPDSESNHYWTTVYDPISGIWFDMDAASAGPLTAGYFDGYKFARRHGKVYRLVPGEENGTVSGFYRVKDAGIDWAIENYLIDLPMLDVTSGYTDTADVSAPGFAGGELIYMAVWNNEDWRPFAGAVTDINGVVTFEDVGCEDVLYSFANMKMADNNEFIISVTGTPFILLKNGDVKYIRGRETTLHETLVEKLPPNAEVVLMCLYAGDWSDCGTFVTGENGAVKCALTEDKLYIITAPDMSNDRAADDVQQTRFITRPFLLENNQNSFIIRYY